MEKGERAHEERNGSEILRVICVKGCVGLVEKSGELDT